MYQTFAAFLLFALPTLLLGQLSRGTITGLVTDPTAAAVAGAKISATHLDTNTVYTAEATGAGNYTIPALPTGQYRVEFEAVGFKRAVRPDVTLVAGSTLRLDVTLELGAVTESVEVTAAPAALEVDTARVATNVTNKLVQDLPLVVGGRIRSVFDLAVLAPETKTSGNVLSAGDKGPATTC